MSYFAPRLRDLSVSATPGLSRNLSMHARRIPRITHRRTSPARRARYPARAIGLISIAAFWSCRDSTAPDTAPHPAILRATSDTVQQGVVGSTAASNPSVIVLDQNGAPLGGVRVEFSSTGLPGGFVDATHRARSARRPRVLRSRATNLSTPASETPRPLGSRTPTEPSPPRPAAVGVGMRLAAPRLDSSTT